MPTHFLPLSRPVSTYAAIKTSRQWHPLFSTKRHILSGIFLIGIGTIESWKFLIMSRCLWNRLYFKWNSIFAAFYVMKILAKMRFSVFDCFYEKIWSKSISAGTSSHVLKISPFESIDFYIISIKTTNIKYSKLFHVYIHAAIPIWRASPMICDQWPNFYSTLLTRPKSPSPYHSFNISASPISAQLDNLVLSVYYPCLQ